MTMTITMAIILLSYDIYLNRSWCFLALYGVFSITITIILINHGAFFLNTVVFTTISPDASAPSS